MKKHRLAHLIYQFTPPQHSTIVLRLLNKLEACKAKLDESYDKFATILTDYRVEEMHKLDAKSPKLAAFLW
jgi:hypothetical protein